MRLGELRERIRTASELHGIVNTMRALSEMRLIQAQRTFGNVIRYSTEARRALERGLALVGDDATRALAGGRGRDALFVLGSEHGFVGALNERVSDEALARHRAAPETLVFVGGSRLARTARERGLPSESQLRLATTTGGIEPTARALTDLVATRLARGELDRIVVVGPRRRGATDWEVAEETVFPVAPDTTVPPGRRCLHYLPARVLVVRLIEEFLFSRLTAAVSEAFLSEQVARVRAMDATRKSLEDKLEELERTERLVRQEVVTSELLEVVSGAEALLAERPRPLAPTRSDL